MSSSVMTDASGDVIGFEIPTLGRDEIIKLLDSMIERMNDAERRADAAEILLRRIRARRPYDEGLEDLLPEIDRLLPRLTAAA